MGAMEPFFFLDFDQPALGLGVFTASLRNPWGGESEQGGEVFNRTLHVHVSIIVSII